MFKYISKSFQDMNIKRLSGEFIRHPLKIINLFGLKFMAKYMPDKMFFHPSFIAIEPTMKCNLRCVMCQIDSLKRDKRELDFEDFKKIIDKLPYTRIVDLQGIGEPFLCKDFFKMLKYANSKGVRIYTFSNANLINKETAQKIINSSLEQLIISIDGSNKKTYEKIRKGANFDVFIENIKYLMSIRNPKKLKLVAWIVPNIYNSKEIEDIVRLCNELGFDRIVIQNKLTLYSYKKELYENNKKLNISNEEEFQTRINEIAKKYNNIEICKGKNLSKDNICEWPWTSLFISSDGKIIPCCVISDPNVVNFGNIFEKNFREIWNSEGYKGLRRNIRKNIIPDYCADCYVDEK